MRSSSNDIGSDGQCTGSQAEKRECYHCPGKNSLCIVGLGPGNPEHMSEHARQILSSADYIVGYSTYIDLIRPYFPKKNFFQSAMKKEIDRVNAGIDFAIEGKPTAIISSGDPGIYAMAGLVFELCKTRNIRIVHSGNQSDTADTNSDGKEQTVLTLEVVPGIPALCSCASLLGAPLTHDFAVISLSDLLTPWEVIEQRIEAAARADFVMVFYNPRSKKRNWQLQKAMETILKYRSKDTPVGIVSGAMRENQRIHMTCLDEMDVELVDMQSTVFVGNKNTFLYDGFMVTPRGYSGKYDMG